MLGLVIERPGNSYQLERRLEGRFGSAQFGHATAYHALKRLTKQGLIRPVGDGDEAAALARAEAGDLPATAYEATPAGITHFRRWLRASTATPPVREELQAKIAFCGPEDLPRMIEIVRANGMRMEFEAREIRHPCQRCGVARYNFFSGAPGRKTQRNNFDP